MDRHRKWDSYRHNKLKRTFIRDESVDKENKCDRSKNEMDLERKGEKIRIFYIHDTEIEEKIIKHKHSVHRQTRCLRRLIYGISQAEIKALRQHRTKPIESIITYSKKNFNLFSKKPGNSFNLYLIGNSCIVYLYFNG